MSVTKLGGTCAVVLAPLVAAFALISAPAPAPPIQFAYQPIAFRLESDETPARNAPETMAGGVAVFDYNRDGRPDIFFANGANIATLKKDDPKYRNRLFRNDGNGKFTDVSEAAGLAGTGYDIGVAVADYDNDGYPDIFVAGLYRNTLYHNNGNGTFTDVTAKAGLVAPTTPNTGRCGRLVQSGWTSITTGCWTCSSSIICNGSIGTRRCAAFKARPTIAIRAITRGSRIRST